MTHASAEDRRPLRVVIATTAGRPREIEAVEAWLHSSQDRVEGIVVTVESTLGAARRFVSTIRRFCPDVVAVLGEEGARVVVAAAQLARTRIALVAPASARSTFAVLGSFVDGVLHVDSLEEAAAFDRFDLTARLAAVAGRPGAGLQGGPDISIVTTVLEDAEGIHELLQRVVPQLTERDEIVVVDGGSTDGTVERVRDWSARDERVCLVEAPGANISAGRNIGTRQAKNSIVACTDAGCAPIPGWLEALRAPFCERRPPSLVTGVYRVDTARVADAAQAAACHPNPDEARRPGPLVRVYGRLFGRVSTAVLPLGRSMAYTVEAWDAAGGFPEHLLCTEDRTFGLAIAASGRECVLATQAEVLWKPRPSLASMARMYYTYGYWDGRSGDRLHVARDAVRALAYLGAPALALRVGWKERILIGGGAAAYLSLPVVRTLAQPRPLRILPHVPLLMSIMDVSKASGCLRGLLSAGVGRESGEAAPQSRVRQPKTHP